MARKKATTTTGSGARKRKQTQEEKYEKRRLRAIRSSTVAVYEVPGDDVLARYENWAIVKQHPGRVKATNKVMTGTEGFWVPITPQSIDWTSLYWLDVVDLKLRGKRWPGLCRACDLRLVCTEEGLGYNPGHNCVAKTENLTEIRRRIKPNETTSQ